MFLWSCLPQETPETLICIILQYFTDKQPCVRLGESVSYHPMQHMLNWHWYIFNYFKRSQNLIIFLNFCRLSLSLQETVWLIQERCSHLLSVWKQECRPTRKGWLEACSNTCFSVWTQSMSWRRNTQKSTERYIRDHSDIVPLNS